MPIDDWVDDEERSVLELFNDNLVVPLFSAPVQTVHATAKTLEYVGSRSRIQIDNMTKMSKSLLDGRERGKNYGSLQEWRLWFYDHVMHINGVPLLREIFRNLPSGITVALVYIPLSISLGIAADASPESGFITAIWTMLAAGVFGGSHHNIVGPAGALTGILSKNSIRYGVDVLPLLSIITGTLCIGVFMLQLDQCVQFVPLSVVQGFSLGVSFSIAANQLDFALGLPRLPRHERLVDNVAEQIKHADQFEWQCCIMFFSFFSAQLLLSTVFPRIRRVPIPWAVIMASIGMGLGYASAQGKIAYRIQTLVTRYPTFAAASVVAPRPFGSFMFTPECQHTPQIFPEDNAANSSYIGIRTSGRVLRELGIFEVGNRKNLRFTLLSKNGSVSIRVEDQCVSETAARFNTCIELFQAGISIAFVVVLQTLISANIAAKVTKVKCNTRKEVLAVGFANILSGVLGGFPATATLSMTPLNIKSGAKSRISSIIAALLLIVLVSVLLPALKYIPLACVAAILMNVSYRMLEMDELKRIFKQDKGQFIVVVVVAVISVVEDATTGIAIGWTISMLKTCLSLSKGNTKVIVRQGSSVITTFYTDIVLTDKVMPPFLFRTKPNLDTPDAIQESFVFIAESRAKSKEMKIRNPRHASDWVEENQSSGELVPKIIEEPVRVCSSWEEVRALGVAEGDESYNLVLHYVMQGQLSFITCSTHRKRLSNVQCDVILVDLTDISSVDLDGQLALDDMVTELESSKKSIYIAGLCRQSDRVRSLLHTPKLTRLQDAGRVIESYHSSMDSFLTKPEECVSLSTIFLKQELLIDPHQRV